MLKDAEEHAEEDKLKQEEVEVRNEADSLAFRAEKSIKEYKDKLPEAIVSDVQSKVDAVKKALEGTDLAKIRAAKDELNEHMQKIGESMQAQASQPGAEPQGSSAQGQPEMEEADVEILDKE